jgi:hypothetical protein
MNHTTSSAARTERRRSRRYGAAREHQIVSARIPPGHRVRLIDVSASGSLLETNQRLLPGKDMELLMDTGSHAQITVHGRVMRCAVVRVCASFICYRGAIEFDDYLPWFADETGYGLPTAEQRSGRSYRPQAAAPVR